MVLTLNFEQNFANMRAGFHIGVGSGGIGQWKYPVHFGPQRAVADHWPNRCGYLLRQQSLKLCGARA